MEYGTRLTIKTYPVTEVDFGSENKVTVDGTMTIDASVAETIRDRYPDIVDIGIRIIKPGEHNQYTNTIMDVVPIATKALGKIGEGITHNLGGVYVLLTGVDEDNRQVCNFGASNGIMSEHIAYGRPGTPDEDDLLIAFDVVVKSGSWTKRPAVLQMHRACNDFIQIFRNQMKKFDPRKYAEKNDFQEEYIPGRKDVAIFKEVSGQGAVYETLAFPDEPCGVDGAFSVIDSHWMPIVLTANEYRDGVLHALD